MLIASAIDCFEIYKDRFIYIHLLHFRRRCLKYIISSLLLSIKRSKLLLVKVFDQWMLHNYGGSIDENDRASSENTFYKWLIQILLL
jgi:hypothetical protein